MHRLTEEEQVVVRRALLDTSNPKTSFSGFDVIRVALHTSNLLNTLHDRGFRNLRIVKGHIIGLSFDDGLSPILAIGIRNDGTFKSSITFDTYKDALVACEKWDCSS